MKTKRVSRVLKPVETADDRTRARILEVSRDLFFKLGFSRVTMDEMAFSLGISKATLYKYFSSKEQLLRETVFNLLRLMEAGADVIIRDESKEFEEKLRELLTFIGVQLTRMSGLLTLDIQRNAAEVWKDVEEFRKEKILSKLERILEEGVRSGVFRSDFKRGLLVHLYFSFIQSFMNPATLIQFSLSYAEAFETIIRIFLEGILADKGRARYFTAPSRKKGQKGKE